MRQLKNVILPVDMTVVEEQTFKAIDSIKGELFGFCPLNGSPGKDVINAIL